MYTEQQSVGNALWDDLPHRQSWEEGEQAQPVTLAQLECPLHTEKHLCAEPAVGR